MPYNPTLSKSIWPFSPQSIAGCVLWLDAADSNSVQRTGNSVTQWTDKSGQGNHATPGVSPTYVPNSQNNLATISFDGASNYFDCPLTIDFSTHCLFAVHNPITTDPNSPPDNPGGNTGIFRLQNTNGYIVYPYTYAGAYGYVNDHGGPIFGALPDNSTAGVFQIISANISSGNSATYVNGVQQASAANDITSGQSDTLSIGAYGVAPYQQQYYWGSIAEIIVFSRYLTNEERHQVDGYLAWKWNIGSLPTAHPYYGRQVFSRAFQPLDILGCQLWLDAADNSTITLSGSSVTQWKDKSGNGFVATPLDSAITKTTLNGNTALNFGGNRMTISNFTWNMSFTSIVVWKTSYASQMIGLCETTNSGSSWQDYISTANWALIMLNYNGTNSRDPNYIRGPTDAWSGNPAPVVTANQWFIFSIGYTDGTTTITNYAVNGSARNANAVDSQTGSNTGVYFINGLANGAYDYSQVAEIIHYNTAISTSQREQVEAYLACKWNLQSSLPSTHPGYRLPAYSVAYPININFSPSYLTNLGVWLDPSDFETFTLSGSNVTDITSKAVDENQISQWYSPSGGVILRTINDKTAFGFTGGYLRDDSVYFPNGYNMSIFTIAQIPSGVNFINIFSKGIVIQLTTGGIDVVIYSDDGNNSAYFFSNNGNQMPTSVNKIYFISLVITTPENTSQPSCYCTINGVELSMQPYQDGSGWASIPYGTETYLITDFGDSYPYDTRDLTAGESIIYTDNKSISECQKLEGYLAWKWGAQSLLPSTHPYALNHP